MADQIDILGVGDIVTDAFIELEDAWIEEDNPQKNKELCMRFGDKIPYKDVVVVRAAGNSPNATVCAHRLGLKSALVTDVGDDEQGKEKIEALEEESINTEFVRIHESQKSNYNYILRFKEERTILVKHHEYEYSFPQIDTAPRYLYLSSLSRNSLPYHKEIALYLEKHPETKLVLQPGTFQMKLGYEKISELYKLAELFFCNKQEAQKILKTDEPSIKKLIIDLHALGPKIVVITDGPEGAYAYDGSEMWHGPMYPDPKPPVDRTGAGDSFSSTFTSALALEKTIPEALSWGPINSMSVVQHIGAQKGLLTREKLEKLLEEAPEDYKPEKIN